MKKYNIAVVGATGNVGREVLSILSEREFPVDKVYAIASRASLGKKVSFGETEILKSTVIEEVDFSKYSSKVNPSLNPKTNQNKFMQFEHRPEELLP